MSMKGGNATELYVGDGRLRMAREVKEAWPYVVEVKRVYGRPQHRIKFNWRHFDTQLQRRDDIDWNNQYSDHSCKTFIRETGFCDSRNDINKHIITNCTECA